MERVLELYGKVSNLQKLIATLVLVGLILWTSYDSEISPAQESITQAKQQALTLEQEISQLQEVNKSMASIKDELRRAEDEMTALKAILPEDPKVEELLASFSAAAKASGVTLVSFLPKDAATQPSPVVQPPVQVQNPAASQTPNQAGAPPPATPQNPAPPQEEPIALKTEISLKIRGGFAETVMFFDRTLQFDRIIHLGTFAIESAKTGKANNSQRVLDTNVTFFAYSQKSGSGAVTPSTMNHSMPPPPSGAPPGTPPSAPSGAPPVSETTFPRVFSRPTDFFAARSANARTE
jgi:Tfp pilus assembly protein PilO